MMSTVDHAEDMDTRSLGGTMHSRLMGSMPTPLARGLREASSKMGSDADRLSRRLVFLELGLRFLVAVQDAELAWLGVTRPRKALEVIDRLERATLGMWAVAAKALAEDLGKLADRPLPPIGRALLDDGDGSMCAAVQALIELRNELAHGSDLASLSSARGAAMLERSDGPFRDFVRGLDETCKLRLVVESRGGERPDETWGCRLALHRGEEPTDHPMIFDERVLPTQQPVLLGAQGQVVRLLPWMTTDPARGLFTVLLLQSWRDNQPRYSGAGAEALPGPHIQPVAADVAGGPIAWLDRLQASKRRRTVPSSVLEALEPPLGAEERPQVRGCRSIRLLGRGGTGAVWLVEDEDRDGARLALKILHPTLATHREHIERLRNEFSLLRSVQVPGVVQVLDVFLDERHGPCLLMEWIDGVSLARVVKDGRLPLARAVDIVRQLLETLAITHQRGIVHRDLKPSNILLEGGKPRLIDFGVARAEDGRTLTATADIVGTLAYAAPEQVRGQRSGAAADIYGVGRVLQDLLLGPDAAPGSEVELPGGLQRVLRRALANDPADRFGSASEMADALDRAVRGEWEGCALDVGEMLPGGLRVEEVGPEIVPGVYLLIARTRSGAAAAALAPRPEGGARGAFYTIIDAIPAAVRNEHGCMGVRVTDDGIPYAELNSEDAERRARALLAGVSHTGQPAPRQQPPPPPPPPAPPPTVEATPQPRSSTPVDEQSEQGELAGNDRPGSGADSALLALGAAAAGALAGHALTNMSRKSAGRPGSGKAGAQAMGQLLKLFVASSSTSTRPAATMLIERTHHLCLFALGMEVAAHGLELSESNWRQAWGTRLGGLLVLLKLHDRSAGPLSKRLAADPQREAVQRLAVELSRTRGTLAPSAEHGLLGLRQYVLGLIGRAALDLAPNKERPWRPTFARIVDGQSQVRGVRTSDPWQIVDFEKA